jgi:hypothetical protein
MSFELTVTSKELQDWVASDMIIDHAGEAVEDGAETASFILTVAGDRRSFKCLFLDHIEAVTQIEGDSQIEYSYPSVEGTVVFCEMKDESLHAYDPRNGKRLFEDDLRKINPHVYS